MDISEIEDFLISQKLSVQFESINKTSTIVVLCDQKQNESILKVSVEEDSEQIENEAYHLTKMSHRNLIQVKNYILHKGYAFMLMDKAQGEPLCDILSRNEKLSENESKIIFRQLVSVLYYMLYSKNRVHLNIKPDNILYDSRTGEIKLTGFACCTKINFHSMKLLNKLLRPKNLTIQLGTPEYMSPEVMKKNYKGPEADVWSLGVTLYAMVTGYFPLFREGARLSQSQDIINQEPVLFIPSELSVELNDLISKMLEREEPNRITLKEIAKHPWILGTNF